MDTNINTTDEQIAAQVVQVPEMFGFLIDRYQDKLDRYIYRKTGLAADYRADVLQDVFVKSYEHINSFDPNQSFNSWIYRICHNTVVNDWKKNKRYREGISFDTTDIGLLVDGMTQEQSTEDQVDRVILQTQIGEVLGNISPKYRAIIELRYLEELSYDEIAVVLQIPPGTVATRINRAKKQISKLLENNTH